MLDQGSSITTVGIYLRSLRTLFNNAISDGTFPKDLYPFGKRKYEIPTGNNIKKALTLNDVASIYNYKAEKGSRTEMARDQWLFIYLCSGINVKDMCLLKYENIKDDHLEFLRAKTARTKRNIEPIRVALNDDINKIIRKWGNKDKDGGKNYIFPILEKGLTPERERQLIQQHTQVTNCHMKIIKEALEIKSSITTYAARHSFATILHHSGVSTSVISEFLGHSSIRTTQNYLKGFEDDSKKEMVKALTAFKK
jgi:integrase